MLLSVGNSRVMLKERHDELNLARLNLVLAQNRTTLKGWRKELALDALGTMTVECTADLNDVVPHGIDNDVLLGLISAAVLQNTRPGGEIRISASELLKLSCLPDNARSYGEVQRALHRLKRSTFTITECWYDQGKRDWRTVDFNLVAKHWQADNTEKVEDIGRWQAKTLLVIRLDPELMQSIRSGYVRPLDSALLGRLKQPMSRSVYRALSMLRTNLAENGTPPREVKLPLLSWAEHLGLSHQMDGRNLPSLIERALIPAHEALMESGYLATVETEGRGRQKSFTYTFAEEEVRMADPEAAQLLSQYLSSKAALELAVQYSAAHVHQTLTRFEALMKTAYKGKVKNRQGLLVDMLRDPDKYPVEVAEKTSSGRRPAPPPLPTPDEEDLAPVERKPESALMALGQRFEETGALRPLRDRAVKLYLDGRVSTLDLLQLRSLERPQIEGQISGWEQPTP